MFYLSRRCRYWQVIRLTYINRKLIRSGELFAAGPYVPNANVVEQAIDSSRYFVLRVEDSGK
jgi:hypothetical protein